MRSFFDFITESFLVEGRPYIDAEGNKWQKLKSGGYSKNGIITDEVPDKASGSKKANNNTKNAELLTSKPETTGSSSLFSGKMPKDKEGEPPFAMALEIINSGKKLQEEFYPVDYFIDAIKNKFFDLEFETAVNELTFPIAKKTPALAEARATFFTIEMKSDVLVVDIKYRFNGCSSLYHRFRGIPEEKYIGIDQLDVRFTFPGYASGKISFTNDYIAHFDTMELEEKEDFKRDLDKLYDHIMKNISKVKKSNDEINQINSKNTEISIAGKQSYEVDEKKLKRTSIDFTNDNNATDFILNKLNLKKYCNSISKKLGTEFTCNVEKINGSSDIVRKGGDNYIRNFRFANGEGAYGVFNVQYLIANKPDIYNRLSKNKSLDSKVDTESIIYDSYIKTDIFKITLESLTLKSTIVFSKVELDDFRFEDGDFYTCPNNLFSYQFSATSVLKTTDGKLKIGDYTSDFINLSEDRFNDIDSCTAQFIPGIATRLDLQRLVKKYGEKVERAKKMLSVDDTYKLIEPDFQKFLDDVEEHIRNYYAGVKLRINGIENKMKDVEFPYTKKLSSMEMSENRYKKEITYDTFEDYLYACLGEENCKLATDRNALNKYIKNVQKGYIEEYKMRIAEVQEGYGTISNAESNTKIARGVMTVEAYFTTPEGIVHMVTFKAGGKIQEEHLRTKITLLKH